jgi:hypothetical protein
VRPDERPRHFQELLCAELRVRFRPLVAAQQTLTGSLSTAFEAVRAHVEVALLATQTNERERRKTKSREERVVVRGDHEKQRPNMT